MVSVINCLWSSVHAIHFFFLFFFAVCSLNFDWVIILLLKFYLTQIMPLLVVETYD